jgi:hypothetical protein
MPISDIINLTITTANAGPTQKGYGIPMILGYSQRFAERARTYTSSAGMVADGFLTTDPEYLAATKLEAQNPKVEKWIVGRGNNRPTYSWRVTVSQTLNLQIYSMTINGQTVSFTSDASATVDEIRNGLKAAIDALGLAVTVTVPGAQTYIDIVANAVGFFVWVTTLDTSMLAVLQNHADPGIAADLAAIALYDSTWYGLVTVANSQALVLAAAAWIEANGKLYIAATSDTQVITTAAGSGDVADTVKTTNYGRTAVIYHQDASAFAGAAWLGNRFPYTPGQETWKFAQLAGVATTKLTATHIANLTAKRANFFYDVAGIGITAEGKVGANDFIDIVRGRDWLSSRISERVFATLAGATTKIPFTDKGAQTVAASVLGALREGVVSGLLAEDPSPSVTVPKISTVSSVDKGNRLLPNVNFTATLAGAVHKVTIQGQLSI